MSKHRAASLSAVEAADTGDGEIRDLIQGAGPRPAVPVEDLAEIRSVAKGRWREMVKTERERSRFQTKYTVLALAASLLLAVALGWWLMPEWGSVAPDLVASIELLKGEVLIDDSTAVLGSSLPVDSVLETGEEVSGTALRLAEGQSVRLDQGTRVRLTSNSGLELERGAIYVDTFHASRDVAVAVSTPFGMVRDIGTQFEIRIGGREVSDLTVRVRDGEIVFEGDHGTESVKAGDELTLRDGSVGHSSLDAYDEAWTWVEHVTPPMDIEGAPLASYLEWVSRETGRELRYSDELLAESAKTIRLSGSIEDHTPEESLSILPSSGLGHRLENGWLLIERP